MWFISKNKRNPLDQHSHSQSGEDLIVNRILGRLKVEKPYYLDLGAYHPHTMSNTFHFYQKGCEGAIVEANPNLIPAFKRERPNDTILNIGVGSNAQNGSQLTFFVFQNRSVSTFSQLESEKLQNKGEKLESRITVGVYSLNSIVEKFCKKTPDFISVDLEGTDHDVLSDFDFSKHKPKVVCVETIIMPEEKKNETIFELMKSNGYMVYADTYINTIFVHEWSWENRY